MAVTFSDNRPSFEGSGGMSITLRSIVITLYRRKWIILAITLPMILSGGWGLLNQSGSYFATARVLVELTNVDQPEWNSANRNVDYDRELSTFFNIAMSVTVAEMAAKSLEDSIPMIRDLDPALAELYSLRDLTEFLMNSTNVSVIGESRILEFQVSAPHPRLALMGVGAMRDAFVEYQIKGRNNSDAIAYYVEQIAVVRTQMNSLLMKRSKVLEESGYSEMDDQFKVEAANLVELKYQLMKARSARKELEFRYKELLEAIEKDPRDFPMGLDESRSSSLVHWQRLVTQHENNLNMILATQTQTSIPVVQQKDLLKAALANLHREEVAYVGNVRISLEELRVRESMIEEQVAIYEKRQKDAPQAYYQMSIIDTETRSMLDVMESLQGKLGEVRIANQADERISAIIPLTNPELATIISGGKSIMYFLIIVFFALALGTIVGFVLEILDHRISSPEEITEHFHLPVFANIRKVKVT